MLSIEMTAKFSAINDCNCNRDGRKALPTTNKRDIQLVMKKSNVIGWKCNIPMNPHICQFVGRLVIISEQGGMLTSMFNLCQISKHQSRHGDGRGGDGGHRPDGRPQDEDPCHGVPVATTGQLSVTFSKVNTNVEIFSYSC